MSLAKTLCIFPVSAKEGNCKDSWVCEIHLFVAAVDFFYYFSSAVNLATAILLTSQMK